MENILNGLNEAQIEAVKSIDGALLILAGSGTGKTKTIVSRLSYLIAKGVAPNSILTLTFTNKAASDMRKRALKLLNGKIDEPPLLCTFHKFGLLFLKENINKINRSNNFMIIDTEDKKNILKNIIKKSNFDISASQTSLEISKYKNSLIKPKDIILKKSIQEFYKKISKVYEEYEAYLEKKNLVDFDDLLAITYRLLDEFEDLAKKTSSKYRYIMVDEYQDTNRLQAKILKKLSLTHNNICVVGDDDQTIYGWRGANIDNILNFSKEYKDVKVIKLEYNYRSPPKIVEAGNLLIEHNRNRINKKLKPIKKDEKNIEVLKSIDEKREALLIANRVKKLILSGVKPNSIAILYRLNILTRSLEEGLNRENIPYKIIDGVKFYERSEIKDIISYLRIIANPNDNFSLIRVINRPRRGIGRTSFNKIEVEAFKNGKSIYQYFKENRKRVEELITKKAFSAIENFFKDIEELNRVANSKIFNLIEEMDNRFAIKKFFSLQSNGSERVENIDEFYQLFKERIEEENITIDKFLDELSLESEQDLIDDKNITITTIHASKGLEFDYLFLIGLEEGFFPIIGEGVDLEEERRIAYVAITRAKKELILSYVESRFYKGKRTFLTKSPFLKECGVIKGGFKISNKKVFKKGDLVEHRKFGKGRVLGVKKRGRDSLLIINFGGVKKEIISSFIEKI